MLFFGGGVYTTRVNISLSMVLKKGYSTHNNTEQISNDGNEITVTELQCLKVPIKVCTIMTPIPGLTLQHCVILNLIISCLACSSLYVSVYSRAYFGPDLTFCSLSYLSQQVLSPYLQYTLDGMLLEQYVNSIKAKINVT